jgi:hypothetical protein
MARPHPADLLARRGRDSRSCSDVRKLSRQSWPQQILSRRDPMSPAAGCSNHGVLRVECCVLGPRAQQSAQYRVTLGGQLVD